jgi:hypothetical protein
VWRRSGATTGNDEVVLDIDASLVEIHSEHKAGSAPTYKGGFGFHPTGKAVAQLPAELAAGHHPGDDEGLVGRPVRVRTDPAGCSARFATGCRESNIGFSVVARSSPAIHAAISAVADDEQRWSPARGQDGEARPGAAVAELTELVALSGWPDGTRLIVRREPLHPGAQTSLFPSLEFRYWGHDTDAEGDPVERDVDMRAHIRRLRASGLERFPFADLDANRAWLAVVCFAADLVRWFQLLCLTGAMAVAEPKALRWGVWHTPARVVRRARRCVVRILDDWPHAGALLGAYRRIALLT